MEQARYAIIVRVWREPPVDLLDSSPRYVVRFRLSTANGGKTLTRSPLCPIC